MLYVCQQEQRAEEVAKDAMEKKRRKALEDRIQKAKLQRQNLQK